MGFFVPGIAAVPPLDRDEPRFAQASRQMLESGDFLNIRFMDEPRNKKPAGIHWLQAASVALVSDPGSNEIWPYRMPSVIGAVAAVLLTFWGGCALFGRRAAFLGAAVLAASVLLVVEAHIAKTDAMLLAAVALSQAALARIYLRIADGWSASPWLAAAVWAGVGFGALLKGPIVPLVVGLTVLALKLTHRDLPLVGALRPTWGLPLALAIFGPWLVAATLWGDSAFVSEAVGEDLLPKLIEGQESHGFPPGYFLVLMPLTFWPGSLFVWPALVWAWGRRAAPAVLFCLAWLVPFWLTVEIVPTKLPHYILPVYPALALLTGAAVAAVLRGEWSDSLRSLWVRVTYLGWALIALGFAAAVVALPLIVDGVPTPWSALGVAAALGVAFAGAFHAWRGRPAQGLAVALVLTLPLFAAIYRGVLPAADGLWLSQRAHALVEAHSPPDGLRSVVAGGYREPSLAFALGTNTSMPPPAHLPEEFERRPDALALMGRDVADTFVERSHERGIVLRALGAVSGLNYSKGKQETLTLYERAR